MLECKFESEEFFIFDLISDDVHCTAQSVRELVSRSLR